LTVRGTTTAVALVLLTLASVVAPASAGTSGAAVRSNTAKFCQVARATNVTSSSKRSVQNAVNDLKKAAKIGPKSLKRELLTLASEVQQFLNTGQVTTAQAAAIQKQGNKLQAQITAICGKYSASGSSSTGNTGASAGSAKQQYVRACENDIKYLETALAAYQAGTANGNYPSPPSPWSRSTYNSNFKPLTAASHGGPYLAGPLDTTHYVMEYDASGHVWIEPPGQYDATYNAAHAASNTVCSEVVG